MELPGHLPFVLHWVLAFQLGDVSDVLGVCVVSRVGPRAPVPWRLVSQSVGRSGLIRRADRSGRGGWRGTILTLCPPGLERNAISRDEKEWDVFLECSDCNFQCHWRFQLLLQGCWTPVGSPDAAGGIISKFSKNSHPGRWKLRDWPWAAGRDR